MKRLSIYIVHRTVIWWAVSSVGVVLVFLSTQLTRIMPVFAGARVQAGELVAALGLLCVPIAAWSLTPAFVVAVFAACGKMAAEGELTAIDSLGIPRRRLLVGPLVLVIVGAALSTAMWLVGAPRSVARLRDIAAELAGRALVGRVERTGFFEPVPGVAIYADAFASNGEFKGVFIEDARPGRRPLQLVAGRAQIEFDETARSLRLGLNKGSAFLEPRDEKEAPVALSFERFALTIPLAREIDDHLDFIPASLGVRTGDLLGPPPRGMDASKWSYAFWRRVAQPVGFISLAALAIALALGGLFSRLSVAATLATAVFLLYHLLGRALEMPGTTGVMPSWCAALAPGGLVLVLGLIICSVVHLRWK